MNFSIDARTPDGLRLSFNKARSYLLNADFWQEVGSAAVWMIQSRTEEGVDAGGVSFEPYSEKWKKQRQRRGRPGSIVDLKLSGDMLGAIRSDVDLAEVKVTVSFASSAESEKAYYHNISGAGASKVKRRFLGLTEEEAGAVEEMIKTRVSRTLGGEF